MIVIIATTIINYLCGRQMQKYPAKKKLWAAAAIIIDLGFLLVFKYTGFILDTLNPLVHIPKPDISLPLGISFYTFQVISYIIDVYREDIEPQKSLLDFSTYMTFFPQLIAGPIVRYRDLAYQLRHRRQSIDRFACGIGLLIIGLSKKVLIANQMGALWELLKADPEHIGFIGAWVGAIAFTMQIYFDFSGYSDMARGLCKMFAFEIPINFDYPYISKSITEFWRRWHISLSTWFRDYVYFPLGGSRSGLGKTIRNLLIVWALTGLWHGANWNFVLWGLYYFVLITIEKIGLGKRLKAAPAWITHTYTMFFVVIGWVIFSFERSDLLQQYLRAMFSGAPISHHAFVLIVSYLTLLIAAVVAATPFGKNAFGKIKVCFAKKTFQFVVAAAGLLLCTAALVAQHYNPFLYFRF